MDSFDNPKIVGGFFGGVGLLLVIALLIIPSFAGKDTQFFVTNTVNATSIALGDLTDVTLINTLNKQILVYNSTSNLWENENQTSISTSNATCSNLGSGKILCASYSGNNLAFKSLLAGSAITLSNDTNTITITNAGVWHDIAGTGISVNQTSGNVLITNTLPESTVCSNATSSAGHKGLCKDNTIALRTLLAGSGISLSLNSTDITITNNGVTSLSANSPLSASASSGSVTLSCATCVTTATNPMVLLADVSPAGGATSLDSGTITAKQNLHITIAVNTQTNTATWALRFNSSSVANYDYRTSSNGGADITATGQTSASFVATFNTNSLFFIELDCQNISGKDKLCIWHSVNTGNSRIEGVIDFTSTSGQITSVQLIRISGSGTLTATSNMEILGYD